MALQFGAPALDAGDSAWLSSTKTTVSVNQRALVEKILSRYAVDFFLLKELIQNADDAQATSVEVDLTTATPTQAERIAGGPPKRFSALSVTNRGGKMFADDGWDRIIEIATGNPDENSVGHFGVGFYSVFAASELPRIHSGP
jgi:HSP90 family molecular chaperone